MTEEAVLERTGEKEPNIKIIQDELQQAQSDTSNYSAQYADWQRRWLCQWDDQWDDGRVHRVEGKDPWPWDGASDSRVHVISTIVQEHVTLDLVAFWSAKVQAKSIRPFVHGRDANVAQKMLDWRVYTQMKRELLRELPLAFTWKHALGLAFIGVEWEQQREIAYVPVTMDDIAVLANKLGLGDIVSQILDPDKAYDKSLIDALQAMSPVLPKTEARQILDDLRITGQAEIPITSLRINKPRWTALRPIGDIIFPSETCDIQDARWVCKRELVSESELVDRIVTDGYDPDCVEEALKHKGTFASWWPGSDVRTDVALGSDRDLIELQHFYARILHQGVPCCYKTIFNDASVGTQNLHMTHRKYEYDHQQYPVVALRRTHHFRQLLSSIGIAEEAYTDERDIKVQQDGLNNRTDLIHQPPMIVPTLRAQATKNAYGPRAIMTALQPNNVAWPPLPPTDNTPMLVMEMVQNRLDRRYAIIGGAIDPEIKLARRQLLANQGLGEMELVCQMTLQLQQQYETNEDIQRVAGGHGWNYTTKDIQGQYEISATVDLKMLDIEYAQIKLQMLQAIQPLKESGVLFSAALNIIDPDIADLIQEDQASPTSQERERQEEYNAVSQILSGIEPVKPMLASPQLRLQIIQQILQQPQVAMKLAQDQIGQKLLKNRVDFYQNQIVQRTQNPVIGRALSTQTFNSKQAPALSYAQSQ